MFARVQLTLGVRENAVWIPEEAIVPRGQDSYVFRVVDGKAELVQVQTGTRKVGEVEIMKGIAAGDVIVTEGTQRLAPGHAGLDHPERQAGGGDSRQEGRLACACPSSASAARCSPR